MFSIIARNWFKKQYPRHSTPRDSQDFPLPRPASFAYPPQIPPEGGWPLEGNDADTQAQINRMRANGAPEYGMKSLLTQAINTHLQKGQSISATLEQLRSVAGLPYSRP
jgi:hypothetical protein